MLTLSGIKVSMKILFRVIATLLIFCSFSFSNTQAQVEIQRSKEKVILNGKVYYVHVVKKGETLYSIAKAYGITVADILSNNPSVTEELNPEHVLRIPELLVKTEQPEIKKGSGDVLHIVTSGQTLYTISRIYGVSVKEIEQLNPEVKYDSLQLNQVLKIPSLKKNETTLAQETTYLLHQVEEKETIFSLSKKYKVSIDEILKVNEGLAVEGLKSGTTIKIPKNSTELRTVKTLVIDSLHTERKDTILETDSIPCKEEFEIKENAITVSLLLPLFSSGLSVSDAETSDDTQNEEKIQSKQAEEFNPVSINFIEFYQGVLLALNEFKKRGISVNLHVFDTEKDVAKVELILKNPQLQESDLILGPIYNDQVKLVAEYAKKNHIYMVSPISHSEELLENNAYLFQIIPGKKRELSKCVDLLKTDSAQNIVVVYKGTTDDQNQQSNESDSVFKSLLKERLGDKDSIVKELTIFGTDFKPLKDELDSLKINYVVSPVEDEIFITNLLSTLESQLILCRIQAVGLMEWTKYKGMDINYFYDLQFTFNSPFYIDYEKQSIKDFLKKYRYEFGTEPSRNSKYGFNYCMLGYDLSKYFILGYARFGSALGENISCNKQTLTVAPFQFVRYSEQGGYVNSYQQRLRYSKDYNLISEDK